MGRAHRPRPAASGAERSGSVAVTTALAGGLLFGMAALTLDASRLYLVRRQQQAMTDLAAVAAAANIANARAAAAASLAANGVPAAELAGVELGTYAADPSVPAAGRFTLGGTAPNAARVTLNSTAAVFFGAFLGSSGAAVGTRSVAVNTQTAAFALGSTLASLDGGLANAVLGRLSGSTLSLTAADYAALASANVDLFGLSNALAARVGASGSYAALAGTAVRLADVLAAAADAGAAGGMPAPAVAALRAMAAAVGPSGPSLAFGSLVAFGPYGGLQVGSPPPVSAALPALPLAAAAARLGAGAAEVSTALGASGTSILGGNLKVVMGEPTAGSSYAAVGPVGTTLHTAQTRALLTLQLAGFGGVTGLNLPVYVEVAPATATLSAIGCAAGAPVDPAATLSVTPGAVDGWIGTVTDAALTDLAHAPNPAPAVLTDILLLSVSGRAHATIANAGATPVPFTRADIAAGTMKSTATTDYASSLLSRLFGDLQFGATLLGTPVAPPPGAASGIAALLAADLQPIDAELSRALALLGVTVGDADTWVRATRCGQGALVN